MAAFEAAIAEGFGIECDVRLSRDGVAMVFHDERLTRMTGRPERLSDCDAEMLARLRLPDGGAIPRLDALLALCDGSAPLIIEIKVRGRHVAPICAAVAADMHRHPAAPAAIMSFNPVAVRWFAIRQPGTVRGLVVTQQQERGWRGRVKRALAQWLARPDFIACDIRDLPPPLTHHIRRRGMPVLSWTVRSADEYARAAIHADQIIFERVHD